MPVDNRQVGLLDLAGTECLLERGVGPIGLGHQNHARGVAVEAMDDPRPLDSADSGESWRVRQDRVHECPVIVPRRRMDDHPRRLVHRYDGLILIEDLERDSLRR
jgi:hypothetical protein